MYFGDLGEIIDLFKNSFPISFLFFVPLLVIICPIGPASASHEFSVFRMQQYDLQGSNYGCRSSLVNVEARSVESTMLTRRCVVTRISELTMLNYRDAMTQGAGGLLILLPPNLSEMNKTLTEPLLEIEQDLLQEETQLPIYFAYENEELLEIYNHIKHLSNTDKASTATEALLSSATANGFQLVVSGPQSKPISDYHLVNIQGKLSGFGIEEQLPTIVLVAHYDSYGIAPGLSSGADSNGSGVVMLIELARLFSKLYTNSRTHAKYNLVFLLSGAGKFNYQGTKRWIEDQLDTTDSSLLSEVSYVLCLEALAGEQALNLHVSKPPKEGSPGDIFYKNLKEVSGRLYPEVDVNIVHKKINLADDMLAWEHERFSIRRLPAFTLSHHDSHRAPLRHSIMDTKGSISPQVLHRNVRIVAESLAKHIFNISQADVDVFTDSMQVDSNVISSWMNHLTSFPRPAQLLTNKNQIVHALEQTFNTYLKDVQAISVRPDKRDPEYVFYDGIEYTMNAYNVKPAVFDLFLAIGITAYLSLLYLIMQNFSALYQFTQQMTSSSKSRKGHKIH